MNQSKGREARTSFEIVESFNDVTLLLATLSTGRNHQIRRHASSAGHAVAGDRKYGAKILPVRAPRLALHARRLGFRHPLTGAAMLFETELPADLESWISRLRAAEEQPDA